MVISEVVQELVNGEDFRHNIELLKPKRREAILYLVSIFEGGTDYRLAKDVDPRDAHDTAQAALAELSKDDFDFLVELLDVSLLSEKSEPAFSIAWVMAYSRNRKSIEPLMRAMKHKDEFVRWAACTGVQRFRVKRARPLLNSAAADRSSLVRGCAVRSLKALGDNSSVPVLKKRLHDRYPGIRAAAGAALKVIERRAGQRRLAADGTRGLTK